ncbi:MAG TPA: RIP metalloprotease RseP [Thermohalobaculum sp.]|nr:RIP metalloprotease RseP [Thermohalobaculum sp.]
MELLAQIPLIGGFLKFLVPFLGVLTVVVFVHEFGHYIVGRWCGIRAEVFSVGFGKPLLKWTDRWGTCWQIAVLPLGGFVKFVGDMDPASAGRIDADQLSPGENKVAFHNAGLLRRVLTVAAGPVANFLLSVAIFAGILLWAGQSSDEPIVGSIGAEASADVGFEAGDRVLSIADQTVVNFGDIIVYLAKTDGAPQNASIVRNGETRDIVVRYHSSPVISAIDAGMPAAVAGMLAGDIFLSIDGEAIHSYRDLQLITAAKTHGAEITVDVDRGGEQLTFSFVPALVERSHPETNEKVLLPTMGIKGSVLAGIEPERVAVPIHRALSGGFSETWKIISGTMGYLHDMAFKGADTSQLGGPIRIAEISGNAAEQGSSSLIYLIAVLSTSIGLINLFPIPILDGGHLMFYAIEFIRGRPVGETAMKVGTMIGLSLVLLLMVFATYNDLVRL